MSQTRVRKRTTHLLNCLVCSGLFTAQLSKRVVVSRTLLSFMFFSEHVNCRLCCRRSRPSCPLICCPGGCARARRRLSVIPPMTNATKEESDMERAPFPFPMSVGRSDVLLRIVLSVAILPILSLGLKWLKQYFAIFTISLG